MFDKILALSMNRFDNKYHLSVILKSNGVYSGVYDTNTKKWIKLIKVASPTYKTEDDLVRKVKQDLKLISDLVDGSI
jgi:hypothetical protein